MKYRVEDIKLKHLGLISSEEVDYPKLMVEVFGYKNTFLDKTIFFKYKFKKMFDVINEIRAIDISKVKDVATTNVKAPLDVDMVSFQARLEIGTLKETSSSLVEQIVGVISILCYETHYGRKFNSDSLLFKAFQKHILNQPLIEMVALYNVLEEKLIQSNEKWNMLFQQVQVIDVDYEEANGSQILGRFSLLKMSKKLIEDFNKTYEEAFLLPYVLVQTNSLESASSAFVQERMTKIKERRFKQQQNTKPK